MAEAQKMSRTVVIGCKLPNGATLHLHKEETFRVPDGANRLRDEQRFVVNQEAPVITLPGIAVAKGDSPKSLIFHGATLTSVDGDFMREWMKQNAKHPWLTNGMIFVAESRDAAESMAKERAAIRSGQEPLQQSGDPRARGGRFKIEPNSEKVAA